jgi:uncharacterized protein (DUF1015 family)
VAEITPFRAVRYDLRRAGPLDALVAPPYDVIGPEERAEYLGRSPYNVVHLTLPDTEEQAGRDFGAWREEGVLAGDEAPSLWALEQDYVGPDGVARKRRGLIAALRAEPYERRVVLPHERTHAGPKEGRLRLLRAVRAQLEPLFFLYEGRAPFEVPACSADLEGEGAGSRARLWRIDDSDAHERLRDWFAGRRVLIADGHHRYETALIFHAEDGSPQSAFLLAVLVSIEDEGLTIFPTHRVAAELNGRDVPTGTADPRAELARLESEPRARSAAVVYRRGGASTLLGRAGELDVELVARFAPEVTYTASAEDAIAAVDEGRAQAAFLLRPLRVEDVFRKAERGETMPQKSTYFYPKLLSGLLFLAFDLL